VGDRLCLILRLAGPGADECYKWNDGLRCCNLSLKPCWKRIEVAQLVEGKAKLLDLRAQATKKIVGPSREVRIAAEQYLHTHCWNR
jgi:hypothetical protein